jgi:CDP-paratose 2-epimerase
MSVVLVTGSNGLVGSFLSKFLINKGFFVVGIDNDLRSFFFGSDGSTAKVGSSLENSFDRFILKNLDIRDIVGLEGVFKEYGRDIHTVIHCAAQPSHDWAAKDPVFDFTVNANGTLNLLELTRKYCSEARFIFTSSNKVYGDQPNKIEYVEDETRWLPKNITTRKNGFDENLSIDNSLHSLFGVSKASADLLVQEYGRYFGMYTAVFRGGCLTGPDHAGVALHGFLSYLVKCFVQGKTYTVFGYKGKQVRDNIHVADLAQAFWLYMQSPTCGAIYNIGGGQTSNISILEAINLIGEISGKKLHFEVNPDARIGDHIWYVSNTSRFVRAYPDWKINIGIEEIVEEMISRENLTAKQ